MANSISGSDSWKREREREHVYMYIQVHVQYVDTHCSPLLHTEQCTHIVNICTCTNTQQHCTCTILQTVDWLTLLQVSDDMAALKACHLVKDNASVKWIQTCTCTVYVLNTHDVAVHVNAHVQCCIIYIHVGSMYCT